jgi:hypothetical protein
MDAATEVPAAPGTPDGGPTPPLADASPPPPFDAASPDASTDLDASTDAAVEAGTLDPDASGDASVEDATVEGCDYPYVYDTLEGCRVLRVLVLNDAGTSNMVAKLESEGFAATDAGLYWEWPGTVEALSAVDTVLWLEGVQFGRALKPGVDALLASFVAAGGGLIRTEWSMYGDANPRTLGIMPVLRRGTGWGEARSWTVVAGDHPLTRQLPETFDTVSGYTDLEPRANATVVVRNDAGEPALSYTTEFGGVTVHVNDDVTYSRPGVDGDMLRVYFNAVHFSATGPSASR